MKTLILLPTGIADVPVAALDGRTPLEEARVPHLDRLAREARVGLVRFVPEGLRDGSDAAVLSVLGYDPRRQAAARGGLEAAGLGVALGPDDLALRMNLVSTFRGRLIDFNAGHITSVEARLLIEALQSALGSERFSFHPGVGYRNLLIIHGGADLDLITQPPQNVQGAPFAEHGPSGAGGAELSALMDAAADVLAAHDVNRVRVDLAENPADRIWAWGPGRAVLLEPFELRTGRRLAVVAAAPLVRGIGAAVGADLVDVPGATGSWDTAYAAKTEAALAALADHDVVVLHLAAANEACHVKDVRLKVRVIEEIDRFVVGPLMTGLRDLGPARLLVTTDHMTSTVERAGSRAEVPWLLWGEGITPVRARGFTEAQAEAGEMHVDEGFRMLEYVLGGAPRATERPASGGRATESAETAG